MLKKHLRNLIFILAAADPQAACVDMVNAANLAGGPDNISALLVHYVR